MIFLHCTALILVAAICAVGVLHPQYNDNLLQRTGMAAACLGAVAELYAVAADVGHGNATLILDSGVAVFAVGTLWKKYRNARIARAQRWIDRLHV